MFPGIYGFHWTAGNLIFLGIFYCVVCAVGCTLAAAAFRARRDLAAKRQEAIRWSAEFHELPAADRACRHQLAGEVMWRTCANGFDCRRCPDHARLEALAAGQRAESPGADIAGISLSADRLYHRGHTWVKPAGDGSLLIGLDPFAERVVGEPDSVELPGEGTSLEVNGAAWRMWKHGKSIRVLSPVDGVVEQAGGPKAGWYLKVRPVAGLGHLLCGAEAGAWLNTELERLQTMFGSEQLGPTLADGGELIANLDEVRPASGWEAVYGRVFLDP